MKLTSLVLLFLFLFSSCSTAARIEMKDGTYEEGTIENGDALSTTITDSAGETRTLQKAEIVDISHPGDIHFLAGTVVAIIGGITLAVGIPTLISGLNSDEGLDKFTVGFGALLSFLGTSMAGIGLAVGIWGSMTYDRSQKNIDTPVSNRVQLSDGKGLGFSLSF